jgi:protein-S-isoprenylcysteine O-methyltransferase Ste14
VTTEHPASAGRKILAAYHYSRLSVAFAAAVMTAASGAAMLSQLRLRTALIIGCATLLAYWLDDLIDARRDESRDPMLHGARPLRMVLLTCGVLLAATAAALLLQRQPSPLLLLLFGIAVLTLAHSLRHALFGSRPRESAPYFAQVAGWSAACVLSPQPGAGHPFNAYTWMSLAFFVLMITPVIDMWRSPSPQPARRVAWLAALCILAAVCTVVVVANGTWPWQNLALLAAPACNLLLLWIRQRGLIANRVAFIEIVVALNVLCGLLEIGANLSGLAPAQVGPRSFADWFHLAAVAMLGILIAGNLLLRRSTRTVAGEDFFSASVTLGGAIFAFQTLETSLHVQPWLLPWISSPLFDFPAARWLGMALMTASLAIIADAYLVMGHSWRISIDHTGPGQLIRSGPFRHSRNPIYLAGDVFIAGSFLICPTLVALAYMVFMPAVLHTQIRREEKFLSARFSALYRDYAAVTPRYLFRF